MAISIVVREKVRELVLWDILNVQISLNPPNSCVSWNRLSCKVVILKNKNSKVVGKNQS